jgi:hypothetical protein
MILAEVAEISLAELELKSLKIQPYSGQVRGKGLPRRLEYH